LRDNVSLISSGDKPVNFGPPILSAVLPNGASGGAVAMGAAGK